MPIEFELDDSGFDEPIIDSEAVKKEMEPEEPTKQEVPEPAPTPEASEIQDTPEATPKPAQAPNEDQIRALHTYYGNQLQNVNRRLDNLQRKQETPLPDFGFPTDEEWEEDPATAARKNANAQAKKIEYLEGQYKKEKQQEEKRRMVETSQNKAWAEAAKIHPDIVNPDSKIRMAINTIMNNPQTGLKDNPQGPLLAACAIKVFSEQNKPPVPAGPTAEEIGATQERERQEKIKKSAMHGGKQGSGQSKIALDPFTKKLARDAGVSEQTVIDMMMQQGGNKDV